MTQNRKNILILLLIATSFSLILLSSSLSNLQLQAGEPLPSINTSFTVPRSGASQGRVFSFAFLQGLLGLLLLLFMIYVPARFILLVKIKWLFRVIEILSVLLIVALLFSFIRFESDCQANDCSETGAAPSPVDPVFSSEGPPLEWAYFVGFGLALGAGILLIWILTRIRRPVADRVVHHAKDARQALWSGRDFRNVILQCYSQMSATLQEEQGIVRSSNMTSREFETLLADRGFPAKPVHELTLLFEKVRYSQEQVGNTDERQAMDSLGEIVDFAEGKPHE